MDYYRKNITRVNSIKIVPERILYEKFLKVSRGDSGLLQKNI